MRNMYFIIKYLNMSSPEQITMGVVDGSTHTLTGADLMRLARFALFDGTTGLVRGEFLQNELEKCLQDTSKAAILILTDIARFSSVNNNASHVVGDKVLNLFAQELLTVIRVTDQLYMETNDNEGNQNMAYRAGGDEFAILLPISEVPDTPLDLTAIAATKLRHAISNKDLHELLCDIDGVDGVGIRAGATLVHYGSHDSIEDALEAADPKKYTRAKFVLEFAASRAYVVRSLAGA